MISPAKYDCGRHVLHSPIGGPIRLGRLREVHAEGTVCRVAFTAADPRGELVATVDLTWPTKLQIVESAPPSLGPNARRVILRRRTKCEAAES
jgi:hypothetical protein